MYQFLLLYTCVLIVVSTFSAALLANKVLTWFSWFKSFLSYLAQVKDLLNDNANGGRVCPLEGGLCLQVLQKLQTLSGTASAVLRQSCGVYKGADQL